MRADVGNMRNKVTQYEKTAQLERQNGAGKDVAAVEAEIAKMNTKVANLQREVDGLYSQRSAITLG
jgi:predicted  nucleic acid-binding Zn-ribbon protein